MKNNSNESMVNANFKRAKLLIIEDSDDHWMLMTRALKQSLAEVTAERVMSPAQAIALLTAWQHEEWEIPKLILQDLYLPDRKDGWALLKQIKGMAAPFNQIPIVVLSSSANATDVMEAYSFGASSYVVKPTTYEDWLRYFQELRAYWWETVSLPPLQFTF